MFNKSEKKSPYKPKSSKKKSASKTDKSKKTSSDTTAKKRTNAVFNDQEKILKKHCSSNTNSLPIEEIEAEESLAKEALELDTNITFINGDYVKSIASKNNTNDYEAKTSLQQVLALLSTLLPLNDATNQFAWSEGLHKKLSRSTTIKHLVSLFLDEANVKTWMQENKFVLQHLLSHPDGEKAYSEILNDRLKWCKDLHELHAMNTNTPQFDAKQEIEQLNEFLQQLSQKSMPEKLAYYHNPFKIKDFSGRITKESALAFQKKQEEESKTLRSLFFTINSKSTNSNAPSIEHPEENPELMEVDVFKPI